MRHHPSDEAVFDAVVRTGGDPVLLAEVAAEAARVIRRRRARKRAIIAVTGIATGIIWGALLRLLGS